jgi:hypothetical protein
MGLKELRTLGNTAEQIADGVTYMNTIDNTTLGPQYDALLSRARTLTGNPEFMLEDLTDSQINNGLLEGRANAEDIAETRATLNALEVIVVAMRTVINTLPQVND